MSVAAVSSSFYKIAFVNLLSSCHISDDVLPISIGTDSVAITSFTPAPASKFIYHATLTPSHMYVDAHPCIE